MRRMQTGRLRSMVLELGEGRPELGVLEDVDVQEALDNLGQPAWFVWLLVRRDCETKVLRAARLALTTAIKSVLLASGDRRHPFVYLLSAREWRRRATMLPAVFAEPPLHVKGASLQRDRAAAAGEIRSRLIDFGMG